MQKIWAIRSIMSFSLSILNVLLKSNWMTITQVLMTQSIAIWLSLCLNNEQGSFDKFQGKQKSINSTSQLTKTWKCPRLSILWIFNLFKIWTPILALAVESRAAKQWEWRTKHYNNILGNKAGKWNRLKCSESRWPRTLWPTGCIL